MMIYQNSYFDPKSKRHLGYSYHMFKLRPGWSWAAHDPGANVAAKTNFGGTARVETTRMKIRGTSYGVIEALNLYGNHPKEGIKPRNDR